MLCCYVASADDKIITPITKYTPLIEVIIFCGTTFLDANALHMQWMGHEHGRDGAKYQDAIDEQQKNEAS